MRLLHMAAPSHSWTAFMHHPRHTMRMAAGFDSLETRQLLSVGQPGAGVGVLPSLSNPATPVPSPRAAVSGDSGVAGSFHTPGGLNESRVDATTNGLTEMTNVGPPSAATLPTLAALGESPTTNETEVNPNLSYLAVTWLNPIDTSPMAAVLDTQVDADAYLVPSTTDQLEELLGERASPASERGTMFADLEDPSARLVPALMQSNTTSIGVSNPNAPGSVTNAATTPLSNSGQSAPKGIVIYPQTSSSDEFVEPPKLVGPPEPPPGLPAPPAGQAPAPGPAPVTPQPAGQAPVPGPAPVTPQPAGQAPAPGAAPETRPKGEQAPAPDSKQTRPPRPPSDAEFDAALDLIDARISSRFHECDASDPDETLAGDESSRGLSVFFAAAVVGSGGLHLAMHRADRSGSKGRCVPRWLGAERPTRGKAATPSR
jgi:hypothetical protein